MYKKIIFIIAIFIASTALRANASFDMDYIVSDTDLINYKTMDINQIQNFLIEKNSPLANYVDPNLKWTASYTIDYFSRYHRINPEYIIVLLQKEQSLITGNNPSTDQFNWATGYGICDGCSKSDEKVQKYKGFVNQVDWGAGGTKFYFENPNKFKFKTGGVYNIDGKSITMKNDATRTLYTYTPHIHGNKNLYNIWQEWFSTSYIDGSLLQNDKDGGIWLIRDGKKHPFLSKSAYLSRYNTFDKVISVNQTVLDKYPIGSPIEYPDYSLLQIPTGGIYLLDDDTLRPIKSKETFRVLGFNPEEIINVESKDIFSYKIGKAITEKDAYPVGALLQDNTTGGIYYVEDGIKRPILSKNLLKYYYGNKKITPVTPTELEKYETKNPVMLKDGELVVGESKSTVYVISNQKKRPFVSGREFESLGYKWGNVIKIEDSVLALHDLGNAVGMN